MRVDGFTWLVRGVKSNRMLNGCVHNETLGPCESASPRDFAPLPEYVVTAFSWGRTREGEKKVNRVVAPSSAYQPHSDAIADLMKARALSHLISAHV